MPARIRAVFLLCCLAAPAATAGAVEDLSRASRDYRVPQNQLAEEAVARYRQELSSLRLEEKDVFLTSGWELPLTIPVVEKLVETPFDVPLTASRWSDAVEFANDLTSLFRTAAEILRSDTSSPPPRAAPPAPAFPDDIPASLRPALAALYAALSEARPHLKRALESVPLDDRARFMALHEWPDERGMVRQEIAVRRIKQGYEGMKPFRQDEALLAGEIVVEGVDKALPLLEKQKISKAIRWSSPQGLFLINGAGDDIYKPGDLKNVAVLIDLGGSNVYRTPVAAAHEGEIRIAIDLGGDVVIETDDGRGGAGTGIFGIGVLALPNPAGVKKITSGSFSQGFGLGGVGALSLNGRSELNAKRYTQGTGVMGAGLLLARNAADSHYEATRSGQGSAHVRGVGLFSHNGDRAVIKGGLVQPDPREPLGAVSMCQGVAFGPRAYAGGGVGIATVHGDSVTVQGSYFSQGAGYWHAIGVFRHRGNHGTLQARRYDLGSGVHSAFGHFDLYGRFNRVLNWGVGPAHGWDHSIASALLSGDDNEVQVDWGMGMAQIDSLSFGCYRGNRNRYKLGGVAGTWFYRNIPSYSIQIIEGAQNRLQGAYSAPVEADPVRVLRTPWGLLRTSGVQYEDDLKLTPPVWAEPTGREEIKMDMADLSERIRQSAEKSPAEKVSDLVDVASAFSLDKESPREAMKKLLALPDDQAPMLVDALDPAGVDQMIRLSILIPAYGDLTGTAAIDRLKTAEPQKNAVLLNLMRMHRPSLVFPVLFEQLDHAGTSQVQNMVVRIMGQLLNKDTGVEPGGRAVLMLLSDHLSKPKSRAARDAAVHLLQRVRLAEAFGLLTVSAVLTGEDRPAFFAAGPEDITEKIEAKGAEAFLAIVGRDAAGSLERIKKELRTLEASEPMVRGRLTDLVKSTQTARVASAAVVFGQIAHAQDAEILEPLLEHDRAQVREAAAVALGRMGVAGIPVLSKVLKSGSTRERCLAMTAIYQAVSPKQLSIVERGLKDSDPLVRLSAVGVIAYLPEILGAHKKDLVRKAKKQLSKDEDASVRTASALLQ